MCGWVRAHCVCVRVCVFACLRACVCACMHMYVCLCGCMQKVTSTSHNIADVRTLKMCYYVDKVVKISV